MVKCSFCKRPRNEVKNLISSSDTDETSICDRCVRSAMKELEVGSRKGGFEKPKEEPLKPPMEIKAHLDAYVIGQDQAKRTIATAVYNHFKRRQVAKDGKLEIEVAGGLEAVELEKSNILLLGPSGTGKTYLARTIAKMLNVPFFVADATRLTQAGYVGDDVETLLQGLLQDAQGDVERAQWGIIFLDEVDKIAKSGGRDRSGYRDVTGEGVQQSLLKLLEGSKVNVPRSGRSGTSMSATDVLDTTNILFICAGSFAGIEPIIEKRLNKGSRLGFGSESREKFDQTKTYLAACPEDLLEFGIIPEMLGRLQVLTTTIELSEEDMIRVLTEPRNSIIKQFRALFKLDGVSLEFDPEALLAIARKAKKMPTGARALRSIVEEALGQVMYSLPGSGAIQVRVTEQTIETGVAMVTKETQCKHHYADKSDPEENCTHCGQNQGELEEKKSRRK